MVKGWQIESVSVRADSKSDNGVNVERKTYKHSDYDIDLSKEKKDKEKSKGKGIRKVATTIVRAFGQDLKKKGKKRILKPSKSVVTIKRYDPEPYVPRYLKTKFEEDKKQFFFE